jgi:hypothetical protein
MDAYSLQPVVIILCDRFAGLIISTTNDTDVFIHVAEKDVNVINVRYFPENALNVVTAVHVRYQLSRQITYLVRFATSSRSWYTRT